MSVEFHPVAVTVRPETEDSVCVTLEVPDDLREVFQHQPGQHVVLRATVDGEDLRRSYSICTPPSAPSPQVGIKRIPEGAFSTWATTRLATGDTIEAMAPIGEFLYRPDRAAQGRYVAVAAGSGITPVLSIVTGILEQEPGSQVTLVYGNRTVRSIMFLEELEQLKDRYPERFQLIHVLSREANEIPLFEGRIDDAKIRTLTTGLIPAGSVDAWFLCGPLGMVETVSGTLADLGVDPTTIHSELFFDQRIERPAVSGDAGADTVSLTFTLAGRTSVVEVAADGPPLLDYARTVRSDVPFACRGGMCASCRATVVQGAVSHDRNYALTDEETAAGAVLTCQAHPVGGDVTIDYDSR